MNKKRTARVIEDIWYVDSNISTDELISRKDIDSNLSLVVAKDTIVEWCEENNGWEIECGILDEGSAFLEEIK